MSLDQIATDMGMTQVELRAFFAANSSGTRGDRLRTFVQQAFTARYSIPQIMAYVARTEIMVLHALRMTCVDRHGCDYGLTLDEIACVLRREAA